MSGKTMRNKSQLLKLPVEILRQVNEMIVATGPERKTYDEIAAWVVEQGFQTSSSSIDRYAKWLITLEKVKLLGEQARVIIEEAGQDSPLRIEEAASKLGAVVMMELFQEVMKGDEIDPQKIGRLMGDFAKLQAASVAREKLKADFKERTGKLVKQAAEDVARVAKSRGLTDEVAEEIRKKILGIGA